MFGKQFRTEELAIRRSEKVKGDATKQDVELGLSTIEDMHGNDKADKNADEGVEMVHGGGFVKLGQWLADRHTRYVTFMRRVQKMIAVVTLAEKRCPQKGTCMRQGLAWV